MFLTSEQVIAKRKELKLSRDEFGKQCGLTAAKIWRIETKGEFKDGERDVIGKKHFGWKIAAMPSVESLVGKEMTFNFTVTDEQVAMLTAPLLSAAVDVEKAVEVAEANEPIFNYDTTRYISHSELATFSDCRRRWLLAYHNGLRPAEESPIGALAMGTRIHKALELHYPVNKTYHVDARDALENLIMKDFTILQKIYWDKGEAMPPEIKKKFDTEAKMQRVMIEGYLDWVATDGMEGSYETIAPEQYVEIPGPTGKWMDDRDVKLVGRVDRLVRRVSDGAVMFEDYKSAASIPALVKILPINTQMKHYHMLLNQNEQNTENVVGALYTILRKSMQTQTATPPFYARVEVYHNTIEQLNYQLAVRGVVEQIEQAEVDLKTMDHHWVTPPRPSNDCSWKCPFFQICPMMDDGSNWEGMAETHFVKGNALDYYNPTKKETD